MATGYELHTAGVPPTSAAAALDDLSASWFGTGLGAALRDVLTTGAVAEELLATATAQARALALVWEAHACGAITLPESIAQTVVDARAGWPAALRPPYGDRSA